jgi:hypothetical protein
MTQREKFIAMLDEFEVEYELSKSHAPDGKLRTYVGMEANVGKRVLGHSGFVSEWTFDKAGKFLHVGIYE